MMVSSKGIRRIVAVAAMAGAAFLATGTAHANGPLPGVVPPAHDGGPYPTGVAPDGGPFPGVVPPAHDGGPLPTNVSPEGGPIPSSVAPEGGPMPGVVPPARDSLSGITGRLGG
ncbi:hypothetical protein [Streptomyces sp. NRRL WC-3742]|uniref:hypothetical protein n=1 Tax=Streptomyces sp. NRRL WC-3742 TaxID=1463934 RepID=UPI00068F0A4E|nr:hypothetical protein [Streptomyces sp. NRRL WC-3742]